jgi:hypothetical protein
MRFVRAMLMAAAVLSAPCQAEGTTAAMCRQVGETRDPEEFTRLVESLQATSPSVSVNDALAACGLDYALLRYQHCQRAFRRENLNYVLRYCPEEAWSLARAQCERNSDSVSSRYAEFCHQFYSGQAPIYEK